MKERMNSTDAVEYDELEAWVKEEAKKIEEAKKLEKEIQELEASENTIQHQGFIDEELKELETSEKDRKKTLEQELKALEASEKDAENTLDRELKELEEYTDPIEIELQELQATPQAFPQQSTLLQHWFFNIFRGAGAENSQSIKEPLKRKRDDNPPPAKRRRQ